MKKILALLALLMTLTALTACQPESDTVLRIDSILRNFDRYHMAIFIDAESAGAEEAADRVMGIIRYDFVTDWLKALERQSVRGNSGIEHLLTLIGSRVAAARAAGDDGYDTALARAADSHRLNKTEAQILQWIHERIEYFENQYG